MESVKNFINNTMSWLNQDCVIIRNVPECIASRNVYDAIRQVDRDYHIDMEPHQSIFISVPIEGDVKTIKVSYSRENDDWEIEKS